MQRKKNKEMLYLDAENVKIEISKKSEMPHFFMI